MARVPLTLPESRKAETLQVLANAIAGSDPKTNPDYRWSRSLARQFRRIVEHNGWQNEPLPAPRE